MPAPALALAQPKLSASSQKSNRLPYFVDLTLAGVNLREGTDDIRLDPKSGYYLHGDGEMASGPVDTELFLTSDAHEPGVNDDAPIEAAGDPGLPQVVRIRHLPLQTGRGVRIGDTPSQVRGKLRATPMHQEYHAATGARVYQYEATIPSRLCLSILERREYHPAAIWYYWGVYIFHHERLWSIRLFASRGTSPPD